MLRAEDPVAKALPAVIPEELEVGIAIIKKRKKAFGPNDINTVLLVALYVSVPRVDLKRVQQNLYID